MELSDLIERTKRQMATMTGLAAETISRFDRGEEGWSVTIDMLEHRAIPRTQDVLASFDVALDEAGNVRRWRRTGRFVRCAPSDS